MIPAVCMRRQALQGILRKTAGHLTQYGLCVRDGQLRPCKANGTPSTLWHTLRELGRSQLGILDLHSVRAGHQVDRLPAIDGYNRSLVVLWNKEDSTDYDIREYSSDEAHIPSLKVSCHFKRFGVIQYLWNTDFRKNPKHGRHPPTHWEEEEPYYPEDNKPYTTNSRYESSLPSPARGDLSTIPEEDSQDLTEDDVAMPLTTWLHSEHPDLHAELERTVLHASELMVDSSEPETPTPGSEYYRVLDSNMPSSSCALTMAEADLLVERPPMDQLLSEQHQTYALLADSLEPELLEEVS